MKFSTRNFTLREKKKEKGVVVLEINGTLSFSNSFYKIPKLSLTNAPKLCLLEKNDFKKNFDKNFKNFV